MDKITAEATIVGVTGVYGPLGAVQLELSVKLFATIHREILKTELGRSLVKALDIPTGSEASEVLCPGILKGKKVGVVFGLEDTDLTTRVRVTRFVPSIERRMEKY